MKKRFGILFIILVIFSLYFFVLKKKPTQVIIPKLNLCKIHSLDYYRNQLYNDTIYWNKDTSTINWYLPYIKNIISNIQQNCLDTSHLVYPYLSFDEVVFYNNSLDIIGKTLNRNQISELISIINNPLNFKWGETTFEKDKIIIFKTKGKEIARLSIMDYNYIKSKPNNLMMKFGELNGDRVKRLYKLITTIKR